MYTIPLLPTVLQCTIIWSQCTQYFIPGTLWRFELLLCGMETSLSWNTPAVIIFDDSVVVSAVISGCGW